MGQQCSVLTCQHVENPENAEMSRLDSPDPVMYDLMRKSIQATMMFNSNDNNCNQSCTNQHPKNSSHGATLTTGKRRFVGQSHLLYKNNPNKTSSVVVSPTLTTTTTTTTTVSTKINNNEKLSHSDGMESRNGTTNNTTTVTESNIISNNTSKRDSSDSSSCSLNNDTTTKDNKIETLPKFPTRLLIRRRSLRVVEEGGGTHIYAIRYPEDNNQTILAEQAAPFPTVVRQEQCPSRKGDGKIATPTQPTTELTSFNHLYSSSPSSPPTLTQTDDSNDSTDDHRGGKGDVSRKKSQMKSSSSKNITNSNSTKPIQSGDDDANNQSRSTNSSSSVVNSATTTNSTTQQQPGPEDIANIFSAETMSSPPNQSGT